MHVPMPVVVRQVIKLVLNFLVEGLVVHILVVWILRRMVGHVFNDMLYHIMVDWCEFDMWLDH